MVAADEHTGNDVGPFRMPEIESDGRLTDALVVHSHGRVVYISEHSARWMGANSPTEIIGRAATELISPDHVQALREANRSLRNRGDHTARIRTVVIRLDGSTSDCEVVTTLREWEGADAFEVEIYETAPQVAVEHPLEHQLALIAHASDALISTSFNGFVTSWNPAAERMFGADAERAIGSHITEVAGGQLHPAVILADGGVGHVTLRCEDGAAWIRVSVSTMHNGYVLVCANHTALHRAEKRVQSILDSIDSGVVVIGADGIVESVNPAAVHLFGWNPLGRRWQDVIAQSRSLAYDAAGKPIDADRPETTRLNGIPVSGLVVGYDRGPGDRIWVSLNLRRLDPDDPTDRALLVFCSDITEHHVSSERLTHAATHDHLTGLFNRAHVVSLVNEALTADGARRLWAVLYIDLDNLKIINDTLGHSAGDHLLQTSAERLVGSLRQDDVVARFGGDEFVCLLGMPPAEDLDAVCGRIHTMLMQPIDFGGVTMSTGASIGVRLLADGDVDAAGVLADADVAMYQAKSGGRGQTRIFAQQ
jgi:diguanylate cyclase (GGDEF)-like protein/PAS domain S-box-containing protein